MELWGVLRTAVKEGERTKESPQKAREGSEGVGALGALLKNSMGGKLLSFFEKMVKPALQRNEEEIAATYAKINSFLDEVQAHMQTALHNHEQEVLQIFKEEMGQAQAEVRALADELNRKIALRNESEEVWLLSNELDYFKNEALKLFSTNQQLRVQNKLLAKTVRDCHLQLEVTDLTLQKLKRSSIRHKNRQSQQHSSSLQANKRLPTEPDPSIARAGREFEDSRINIALSSNQLSNGTVSKFLPNAPILITHDDRSVENLTIPNRSSQSHGRRPRSNRKYIMEAPLRQCFDKIVQTDHSGPINSLAREPTQIEEAKTGYDLDLLRNGFRLNATQMKTKRIEIPLRSSVSYGRAPDSHIRSMNCSFLKSRLAGTKSYKKNSLFDQ